MSTGPRHQGPVHDPTAVHRPQQWTGRDHDADIGGDDLEVLPHHGRVDPAVEHHLVLEILRTHHLILTDRLKGMVLRSGDAGLLLVQDDPVQAQSPHRLLVDPMTVHPLPPPWKAEDGKVGPSRQHMRQRIVRLRGRRQPPVDPLIETTQPLTRHHTGREDDLEMIHGHHPIGAPLPYLPGGHHELDTG